jgi:hypothetical protein
MTNYKLTDNPDLIIRIEDDTTIPRNHRWWADYEKWLAAGNTPEPADPPPSPVIVVKMLAARLQLQAMGLLQQVDSFIASMEGPEGDVARIEWEFAETVRSDNPAVLMILSQFTAAQITEFWVGAIAR